MSDPCLSGFKAWHIRGGGIKSSSRGSSLHLTVVLIVAAYYSELEVEGKLSVKNVLSGCKLHHTFVPMAIKLRLDWHTVLHNFHHQINLTNTSTSKTICNRLIDLRGPFHQRQRPINRSHQLLIVLYCTDKTTDKILRFYFVLRTEFTTCLYILRARYSTAVV